MDGIGISGNVSLDMNVQNVVGVYKYDELRDKPKINDVEVSGSKSLNDYGIASKADAEKAASDAAAALENAETNATAIAAETNRATAAEQKNADAIVAETTRAKAAEQALQTNIGAEKTRAETAEQTLQTNIDSEKTRAITAENNIKIGYSRVYDTVESMKNDTTIKEGMICKTLGYRAVNDLGGGVYKINTDASNGYEKISVSNNLTASLVIENNTVNVDCFGAYGDNEHDDADVLNYAVNFCCDNGITLTMSAKHYKINHGIVLNDRKRNGVNIQGQGVYKTYITTDSNIVMFRADTLIRCNIGGFNIESSNSNSTCFMCGGDYSIGNICHFSTLHDINYNHCNGFVLNGCAYMNLTNCRGGTTDKGIATVGYHLSGEYIYLNECSGGECKDKAESIAFDLDGCEYAYLNKCDSAQNWNGIGLRMHKCNKVYVNNHSFSRNKKNMYIDYSDAIIMCEITCDIFNDGNVSESTDVTLTRSQGKVGIMKDCIIKINETCMNVTNIKSVECLEPGNHPSLQNTFIYYNSSDPLPIIVSDDYDYIVRAWDSTNENVVGFSENTEATVLYRYPFTIPHLKPKVELVKRDGTIPSDLKLEWVGNKLMCSSASGKFWFSGWIRLSF